jgi:hypothetical protein
MVQHILSPSYSTIVCKYDITFNYTLINLHNLRSYRLCDFAQKLV